MSALFRIIYAAHANGTHHKLALDALNSMGRADAEAWRRVFLKHAAKYLEGSKAPDNAFKDFKNHVLHVGDNYWGGAPEKVEEWYATTVTALRTGKWEDAAYAAGVLSHYYTDPVMPFHTGQTEAENNVHRATEWSINRSYNALRKLGEEKFSNLDVPVPDGPDWLKAMSLNAAEYSHRYYETLLAHYDITRGVIAPEEGLDPVARTAVAELLIYAAEGFGHILDRAIAESGVAAPEVSLTLATIIAALNMPQKWIEKRLTNAEDKKLVQAMYDELKTTGKVETHLPEDDRAVRDLHAAEVAAHKLAKRAQARAVRISASDLPETRALPDAPPALSTFEVKPVAPLARGTLAHGTPPARGPMGHPAHGTPDAPHHRAEAAPPATRREERAIEKETPPAVQAELGSAKTWGRLGGGESQLSASGSSPTPNPSPRPSEAWLRHDVGGGFAPGLPQAQAELGSATTVAQRDAAAPRTYLHETDPLEAAPSIGPKMAEKFAALGIHSVADFLGHNPHDMAELLGDSRIDAELLTDWQDQAHLVIAVPGLRGTQAQLLVGAGYRTAEAIADADPVALSADVLTFATSSDGKRILRDGNPPDLEKIKGWVEAARFAQAA